MLTTPRSTFALPLCLGLVACPEWRPPVAACDEAKENEGQPSVVPGAPVAGVAETFVDLPIGTPLSGYTSRCGCFGGEGKVDKRDSPYRSEFAPSAGVQTRVPAKAFWIGNGDQDLLILKLDVIYSFDGLVEALERSIEAETGRPMDGRVVLATSHSHASYGDFSDQVTYYLGSDRFNLEIFERLVDTMTEIAVLAHDGLQPVKIGVGRAKDWDGGLVYHDRRGDNDDIQMFEDIPAGSYKDPYLTMIRIDTLADEPLGVLFNFGMHGTSLDGDNPMISVDAPGHVELAFEETFASPVVVAMLQSGGGDASPGGSDSQYANLETVGEYAAGPMAALWQAIPTAAAPIRLETASRSIPETGSDIRVTRNGTVDWYYPPYDAEYTPDDVVYAADGSIQSPLDEFNTPHGSAFCGENPAYLPGFAPAGVFPYDQCVDLTKMIDVIGAFFELTDEEKALPLPESTRAAVTATRFGPVPILDQSGGNTEAVTADFFIGFFPGETTALYTEQFRRRAAAELDLPYSMAVGYAQDHEGYLLLPEDWLQGGYEADINIWGPLQGEHIMEGLLTMAKERLLTDLVEKPDACNDWQIPEYGPQPELSTLKPDSTPEAGLLLTTAPEWVYSPLYSAAEYHDADLAGVSLVGFDVPSVVPRVQGLVQLGWSGGDPGVDFPSVTLQRRNEDGIYVDVLTAAGRPVTSGPDILVTTTPDPLYPAESPQSYTWYAAWQAVGHVENRTGLPVGTYRLHIDGNSFVDDGATTWPWASEPYTLDSPEFEVVPATISLALSGTDVVAWLQAPERGFRLVGLDGAVRGSNPLDGDAGRVEVLYTDGSETADDLGGTHGGGVTTLPGALDPARAVVSVTVTDAWGNVGVLETGAVLDGGDTGDTGE